ncbi:MULTISPECIES: hypothetical protein [unclassified Sphingobacterium]|uniref:hypothetical protein n=1 Tax=unclassified Sphingobacterium TaxID=2609468 RepID=UPI001CBFBBD9|nr:hypothetical protein [Sphingobacterium sp. GVS05A]
MKKNFFLNLGSEKEKVKNALEKLTKEELATILGGEFGAAPYDADGSGPIGYSNYADTVYVSRPR